jgi:hypothetical protein
MAIELKDTDVCAFEDCEAKATEIACGRKGWEKEPSGHPEPATYCHSHGDIVAEEQHPEYIDTCPNCGCRFGVN